jgi:uncharacterized protein
VLADDRPGNTTQSIGLAEALPWPYEVKQLVCRWPSRLHNRLIGARRVGIDVARSSPLDPPWPDLVIAAGRRTAPVALWIRARSGGATRLVALGRKAGDAAQRFDISVVPRYCRLLPQRNRLEITAPLHRISDAKLAYARARWQARLAGATAPRIALLVGGTSGQYQLDAATAQRLGDAVMRMARSCGGSVFVTTSRRLSRAASDALCRAVAQAAYVHRWSARASDNPYIGFLALADAFVVTGDSESMLAEACATGKPVYVAALPIRLSYRMLRMPRDLAWRCASSGRGLFARCCARLIESGWLRPARDLGRLHAALYALGAAHPFAGVYAAADAGAPLGDRDAVVARVRALFAPPGHARCPL